MCNISEAKECVLEKLYKSESTKLHLRITEYRFFISYLNPFYFICNKCMSCRFNLWFSKPWWRKTINMRRVSQSALKVSLMLWKPPNLNQKFGLPPNLVPKNCVSHSFQNFIDTWWWKCVVWLWGGCLQGSTFFFLVRDCNFLRINCPWKCVNQF